MQKSTGPGRIEVAPPRAGTNSVYAVLYNFDFDGDKLKSAHTDFLSKTVVPRLQDPYSRVILQGSASRVGKEKYNLALSERRVNNVARFLKANGVSDYQIQSKAVGESLAFGSNPDNERHRAVAVMLIPGKKRPSITPVTPTVSARPSNEPYQHIAPGKYQFQLAVRTFIPSARYYGFVGDDRGFSMSPSATYRTGMFLVFDLANGRITESLVGNSTGTRRKLSDLKTYAKVRVSLNDWEGDRGRIFLSAHMEGSDPLVPLAPDVDTDIFITAFLKDGNLFVAGEVIGDAFPSTEVFIRDNQRSSYKLMYYPTPYGVTGAVRLMGVGYKTLGTFRVGIQLDEKARFIGSVPWPK